MLESALRVGITYDEFWNMSMREFERAVRIKSEVMKQQDESHWMRAATETAYMMNMIGGAVSGKKWKAIQPGRLFDVWTGKAEPVDDLKERMREADRVHADIVKRESWGYV